MGDFVISIDELKSTIGTCKAPLIFDTCRTPVYDTHKRILPTARWRNHILAAEWSRDLPPGRDVVVYCVHGHNVSQTAVALLREQGVNARQLEGGIEGWKAAGGITIIKNALPGRDEATPSQWVTRIRPKIDRIACPWLISRFIDAEAQFLFVEPDQVIPVAEELGAIPYDVKDVDLTHEGETCSFDTIIKRFGIDDPALNQLALIVRGADTARLDLAPEAAGLLAVSLGISAIAGGDDHETLRRGFPVYDAFYARLRHAGDETHNWPAGKATA